MKIKEASLKFIEWSSPESLHEHTKETISDIEFTLDEIMFLSDLIKDHTLDIISEKKVETAGKLTEDLLGLEKNMNKLLKEIKAHKNDLQNLLDEKDEKYEKESYKASHYKLLYQAEEYNIALKILKQQVFIHIKEMMRKNKQKRLLE